MPNKTIVRLLQVRVLPQYRDGVLQTVRENKLPTSADEAVEVYYQTAQKDHPNTLLFFAVFLRKTHTIPIFSFHSKLAEEPVRTELVELE